MRREQLAVTAAILLAGCAGGEDEAGPPQRSDQNEAAQPAPPPDAGTQAGHGADAREVEVPRNDSSPPRATIVLETLNGTPLGKASQPPGREPGATEKLQQPALRATAIGRDSDGGVARVRVSIKELITCAAPDDHGGLEQRRTRYFPPPQIERIRSNPGTRLATRKSRTLRLTLGRGRCGGVPAVAVEGQLWAEAINGNGLEAVTPHLHFSWGR
jgi:hypothetical protein